MDTQPAPLSSHAESYWQRLERLVEFSRGIGKFADRETLLAAVVELACDLLECEFASILVYEHETETLKYIAGPLTYREALKHFRLPLERSVAGQVYSKSQAIVIPDALRDPRLYRDMEKQLKLKVYNLASVPLIFRGETIGVFEAANKQAMLDFTQEDLIILESLSAQIAVLILSNVLIEEVQRSYEEIQALERMKSNFIAIASHELRTPLGLVIGHASILNELISDETQRSQLEVILRSANRLKSIMEDLSNVNKFQAGTSRLNHNYISINQLIQKMVAKLLKTVDHKGLSLVASLPPHELVVDADEDKIAIVITNLLANAITFTDRGGHINISAERLPGYIQVSVADDGIGIPAKDLPHVFDRFYQVQSHLTRRHGGMGLGLTVAKSMVELHNGQIWVESIEGKGTKFSFLLPTVSLGPTASKVPAFEF